MAKILLIAALVLIAYLVLRARRTGMRNPSDDGEVRCARPEPVVACSRCGVHVPMSESHVREGRYFCSEEHKRLG